MKPNFPIISYTVFTVAAVSCFLGAAASAQSNYPDEPHYELIDRFKVGGDGGWDFLEVDAKRQHLFVTRGDSVQVYEAPLLISNFEVKSYVFKMLIQ